ncbi:MAG: MFS transporter [Planctomycetaceae bacterium]
MNGLTTDDSTSSSPPRGQRSRRLTHNLRVSQWDAASFGVMVGLGETYLALFVLMVGLSEVMSGLVVSVPVLLGGALQMISPWAVTRLKSHKRWVLCCSLLQAASFMPLIVAAIVGYIPAWAALVVASLYWAGGLGTGPAWNVWIGTLVPRSIRAHFFAKRTRLQQATVLAGFLGGGFALQAGKRYDLSLGDRHDTTLMVFAVLFTIAFLCRIASAAFLALQTEPEPLPPDRERVPVLEQLRRYRHSSGGRLLLYIVVVQFGVWITGPYFAPYMTRKLHFSYVDYSVLIAFSFVFKILALPLCGRLAKRWGARRLLTIGGIGIVPLAGMWSVSDNYAWLCVTQVIAGLSWAAYELAFFLLFFESIPAKERVSVLTLFNLLNSLALAAGAMIGGFILHYAGETPAAYHALFTISSAWRALALIVLWRVPFIDVPADSVSMRIEELRPTGEPLDGPILSSLPDETRP